MKETYHVVALVREVFDVPMVDFIWGIKKKTQVTHVVAF
jgi:hypothetical protein